MVEHRITCSLSSFKTVHNYSLLSIILNFPTAWPFNRRELSHRILDDVLFLAFLSTWTVFVSFQLAISADIK